MARRTRPVHLTLASYKNAAPWDPDLRRWTVFMLCIKARIDSPSYLRMPSIPVEMWILIWSFVPPVDICFEFAFLNAFHAEPDQEYVLPYMDRSLFPKTLPDLQELFVQLGRQICLIKGVSREELDPHPSIEVSLDCCTMRSLKGDPYEITPLFVSIDYAPDGQPCHYGQPLTATNPWDQDTVVQDYSLGKRVALNQPLRNTQGKHRISPRNATPKLLQDPPFNSPPFHSSLSRGCHHLFQRVDEHVPPCQVP